MELLQHGVDRSVIALWLGHESVETTQMYLHADLRLKEEALSHTTPFQTKPPATGPATNCWPSLKRCDYAARRPQQIARSSSHDALRSHVVGIIRDSA